MNPKIILIALTAGLISSCSTSYKNGQTPDDVYYSPVKYTDESQSRDRTEPRDEYRDDYTITMGIRDRRWRDFNEDYDYRNSPYHYCNCKCTNYGYYYNPVYHTWPVYMASIIPVNSTPRKVNLNSYRSYRNVAASDPKSGSGINWVQPSSRYNNSNNSSTRRENLDPSRSSNSSSNNTRTYSPSSGSSNNNSNSSGSNSSGTVTRPKRG
ncbi:MAG: hypothetical protein IPP31_10255 [Chitinophagaceae bacterium]|nr:hypothetical protein [Chitinophagaceae bacterium]